MRGTLIVIPPSLNEVKNVYWPLKISALTKQTSINNSWIRVLYSYLIYVCLHLYKNTEYSRVSPSNINQVVITYLFGTQTYFLPRAFSFILLKWDTWAVSKQSPSPCPVMSKIPHTNPYGNSTSGQLSDLRWNYTAVGFHASTWNRLCSYKLSNRQENGETTFLFTA